MKKTKSGPAFDKGPADIVAAGPVISGGVEVDVTDQRLNEAAAWMWTRFNRNVNKALAGGEDGLPMEQIDTTFFPRSPFVALAARLLIVKPNLTTTSIIAADGTLRDLTRPGLVDWMDQEFALAAPESLKAALSGEDIAKRISKAMKAAMGLLPVAAEWARQVDEIDHTVDMFAVRPSLRVGGNVAKLAVPFKPFVATGKRNPELVEKFITEHFVEFNELLGFIAAGRFAADRRQCSVWFHACSDFGKGLVVGAMTNIGAVVKANLKAMESAMAGNPTGMKPAPFLTAWLVFVDEFKAAMAELKEINSEITLAPKNKAQITVPVYTKLFASAEDVQSLTGNGIEKQFDERFCMLRPKNGNRRAYDHDWYNQAGSGAVREALEHHIADFFNAEVERYRELGKDMAALEAAKVIAGFRVGRLLSDHHQTLEVVVEDVAEELRGLLRDYRANHNDPDRLRCGPGVRRILETHVQVGTSGYDDERGQPAVFVATGSLSKMILDYLNETRTRSGAGKLGYKTGDIIAAMDKAKHERTDGRGRVRFVAAPGAGYSRPAGLMLVFPKPVPAEKGTAPIPERDEAAAGVRVF